MKYEGNPKHKEPWQRGKRGSLCPKEIDVDLAQKLLDQSLAVEETRFAVYEGRAFCAHFHGNDGWHGFPVGWSEVPEPLRDQWLKEGLITRRTIKRYWK